MELIRIFDNCLFSFKYNAESKDEFERLFDLWNDVEYLEQFFEENKSDLQSGFWGTISVEDAIIKTLSDAQYFEKQLLELSEKSTDDQNKGLGSLFEPLHNSQIHVIELNKSKAKKSWLRVYALRAEESVYIVTGGAIKLTANMYEREHTSNELRKLEQSRNFLIEQGIVDADGLIEELEI